MTDSNLLTHAYIDGTWTTTIVEEIYLLNKGNNGHCGYKENHGRSRPTQTAVVGRQRGR